MTNGGGSIAGVVRYTLADAIRAQRWIAPVVLFLAAVAIANADAGPVLTTYADTVTVLLPIGIWLTWSVVNAEDPVQADVSLVTVGSEVRYRLGKLGAAFVVCAGLAAVAIATPLALGAAGASASTVASDLIEGLVGHLLVAVLAVAVGALTSRTVVGRLAESLYLAITFTLAEIAVPGAPPGAAPARLIRPEPPVAPGGVAGGYGRRDAGPGRRHRGHGPGDRKAPRLNDELVGTTTTGGTRCSNE